MRDENQRNLFGARKGEKGMTNRRTPQFCAKKKLIIDGWRLCEKTEEESFFLLVEKEQFGSNLVGGETTSLAAYHTTPLRTDKKVPKYFNFVIVFDFHWNLVE